MDLTQLANLGEFIGGVAVLVTLIYLAVQMRQSIAIATIEAVQNSVTIYSSYKQMLANDSVSEAWAKAQQDGVLSPKEKVQIHAVIDALAYANFAAYINPRASGSKERSPKEIAAEHIATIVGRSRTLREAWDEMDAELRAFRFTEFADHVADRLAKRS